MIYDAIILQTYYKKDLSTQKQKKRTAIYPLFISTPNTQYPWSYIWFNIGVLKLSEQRG